MASTSTLSSVITRTRPLPALKSSLHSSQLTLLRSSPLRVFLRPEALSAAEWKSLRSAAGEGWECKMLRVGLLRGLAKRGELPLQGLEQVVKEKGALAVFLPKRPSKAAPTPKAGVKEKWQLEPSQLLSLLALIDKTSKSPKDPFAPAAPASAPAAAKQERLALLSAALPDRVLSAEQTRKLATLPSLQTLRSQVVGLLEAARGGKVVALLGQRARDVGRTVEGYKLGLEQDAGKGLEQSQSQA